MAGRRGAEREARLERLRRLHAAFMEERDRAAIRRFLEERLPRYREIPWWSAGMATFAQFLEAEDAPDNLIRALAAARAGANDARSTRPPRTRIDDDVRPEACAILMHPPTFALEFPRLGCGCEGELWQPNL